MEMQKVWLKFEALPPEAKREVIDFIELLQARYRNSKPQKKTQMTRLREEPFIGMWKDCNDMSDSVEWVRSVRQRDWKS